ncbi:MAG TPA: DUF748 domain-containing protein [Bacteroidales bacterium]|nr:DUF748 domain-containing protein [Bacteroidales bacterium]
MKNKSFKKRHLIIPGIILFIAIILFAAPRIAKTYIVKHSQELIGRKVAIGKIRINYFTGTLRITDLKLFETDGATAFASFRQLKVNLDYLPLFRNEFVVRYISLDDPYVQVLQDGSRFNFSDLIEADSATSEKDTIPGEPTKYIINNIRISRGFVKYQDIPLNHTISLDSLDLQIPGFTWNSDTANLDVGFNFVEGGGIRSGFSVNQADSTYSINLKIDSLNLEIIEPYVAGNLNISDIKGYYSGDLMIKGSITSVMQLFVKGENHISGFLLNDTLNRTILSFSDLDIGLDTFDLSRSLLRINNVKLKNPQVLFELKDSVNNWTALMKSSATGQADSPAQPADTAASGSEFSYNIPHVELTGGTILLSDKNLKYPFSYTIDSLKLDLSEIPESKDRIAVKLSALLNKTGTISTEGSINMADPSNDLDISLEIKQFRMADVDAYFRHYFGFPVKGGLMNFSTANTLRPRSLESTNHIYFRRFNLDKKLPEKTDYNVPLRLAIGILSDKDGIIDLKAPVKMKGDEVKIINLGRIIFRVIGNLFVKAALSPLNLISQLQGVDEESLKQIQLDLTNESPDGKGLKSLDILSDILNKKPLLNLDLIYCINREKAIDSLGYIYTRNDFLRSTGTNVSSDKKISDSILVRFVLGRNPADSSLASGNAGVLFVKYAGTEKLNVRLDSLMKRQTGFIINYLGAERALPSNRFRIIETTPDSIRPVSAAPSFRIYLTEGGGQ